MSLCETEFIICIKHSWLQAHSIYDQHLLCFAGRWGTQVQPAILPSTGYHKCGDRWIDALSWDQVVNEGCIHLDLAEELFRWWDPLHSSRQRLVFWCTFLCNAATGWSTYYNNHGHSPRCSLPPPHHSLHLILKMLSKLVLGGVLDLDHNMVADRHSERGSSGSDGVLPAPLAMFGLCLNANWGPKGSSTSSAEVMCQHICALGLPPKI